MDRILTTHVGSLTRPPDLVTLLRAKDRGEPYDEEEFAACLQRSVADVVRRQAEIGIVPVRRDEFYDSQEEYVFAVADALNTEYRSIVDAGLVVQIDDAYLPTMYDTMGSPEDLGEYRAWAELRIEALNRALEGM